MSFQDFHYDRFYHGKRANDSDDNALSTATLTAEPGRHNILTRVEASYSVAATTGLLQIKFGTTVVAEKYIHGAGQMNFGEGLINLTPGEAISAELAASGTAGQLGKVTIIGFSTGPRL